MKKYIYLEIEIVNIANRLIQFSIFLFNLPFCNLHFSTYITRNGEIILLLQKERGILA